MARKNISFDSYVSMGLYVYNQHVNNSDAENGTLDSKPYIYILKINLMIITKSNQLAFINFMGIKIIPNTFGLQQITKAHS